MPLNITIKVIMVISRKKRIQHGIGFQPIPHSTKRSISVIAENILIISPDI